MIIVSTNCALGYNEIAYFIKVDNEYTCIYSNESPNIIPSWEPGKTYDMSDECACDIDIVSDDKIDEIIKLAISANECISIIIDKFYTCNDCIHMCKKYKTCNAIKQNDNDFMIPDHYFKCSLFNKVC